MHLFFFKDAATPETYPLSLHDALPFYEWRAAHALVTAGDDQVGLAAADRACSHRRRIQPRPAQSVQGYSTRAVRKTCEQDRKSTRLNSSHANISYAVFCLTNNHRPRPS